MKIHKLTPQEKTLEALKRLRQDMTMSSVFGDYQGFKNAKIEYAKIAVKNFELAKTIKGGGATAPLFSKYGLNMLKVMICNFFRKKTPEEKLLIQKAKEEQLKSKGKMNYRV